MYNVTFLQALINFVYYFSFTGDVGGQIGLFIGAGVMSYFEFIDCLILVIHTKLFEKFPSNEPSA